MNILIAYQNYLRHLQDESSIERKKDKGFHASSSGSCYRKQLYAYFEYKSESIDDKGLRVLRLGTIVHKDVEDAVHHYMKTNAKEIMDNNISIFSEYMMVILKYLTYMMLKQQLLILGLNTLAEKIIDSKMLMRIISYSLERMH